MSLAKLFHQRRQGWNQQDRSLCLLVILWDTFICRSKPWSRTKVCRRCRRCILFSLSRATQHSAVATISNRTASNPTSKHLHLPTGNIFENRSYSWRTISRLLLFMTKVLVFKFARGINQETPFSVSRAVDTARLCETFSVFTSKRLKRFLCFNQLVLM